MAIKLGGLLEYNIYLGSVNIGRAYLGSNIVYPADINGKATLSSTTTCMLHVPILFEMEVMSTTIPTFINTSGDNFVITEISTGLWRVISVDEINTIRFDNNNPNNRNNITTITIKNGATLTSLLNSNHSLFALQSWIWEGEFNVTNVSGLFYNCTSLQSYTALSFANVTNFSWMFTGASALTYINPMNTSSGTDFTAMFMNTHINFIPTLDLSSGIHFDLMFGFSSVTYLPVLNTTNGQTFQDMFTDATLLECIGGIDTRNQTSTSGMFLNTISLENPNTSEQASILSGTLYVNSNPCPLIYLDPPIYNLTEAIGGSLGQYWVYNSADSNSVFNGLLEHTGDSSPEGTPWSPIDNLPLVYPQDGTINLVVVNDGTRQINTQWIPPTDSDWTIASVHDVQMGTSYKLYVIHFKNATSVVDVYYGDENTSINLISSDVPYVPTAQSYKIYYYPDSVVLDSIMYNMDDFYTI